MPTPVKPKPPHGEKNTFNLPRGDRLRRELRSVFASQRRAILRYLATGRKDHATGPLPAAWPSWHDFGTGTLTLAERMAPLLALTWDAAGSAFAAKVGLDPDRWDVTNPHLAKQIDDAALAFCASTNATTSKKLDIALAETKEALHQGVVKEGESVEVLTKRINAIFDSAEKYRARAIAQTETSRAVHSAQEAMAIRSGVVTGWEWLLSSDACPICVAIAARAPAVRLGHAFAVIGENAHYSRVKFPPAHPHCCLPETPVIAPVGIAGMKAHYDGPVVRLHLSDGSDVTVTPHHMLLTTEGFAFAGSLMKGDDVLRYRVGEPVTGGDPDDDRVPVPIGKVFDAMAESGRVAPGSVPVAPEYLHGDAALCEGQIQVVTPYRFLWGHLCAERFEPFAEGSLRWPHLDRAYLPGERDLPKVLFALRDATDGGVGWLRESRALLRAHAAESIGGGLGATANLDARRQQPSPDGGSADLELGGQTQLGMACFVSGDEGDVVYGPLSPERAGRVLPVRECDPGFLESVAETVAGEADRLGECLDRLAGLVATCKVVDVERFHYAGPVYDITTGTSLYLIGKGIVSSNCNCTVQEVLDTDPQPKFHDTLHQPEPATDEEWEAVASAAEARDAAILAGKPPKPVPPRRKPPGKPPAARKPAKPARPAAATKPAPPPATPVQPAWKPGTPIDAGRPIGERIAGADHLEAKVKAIAGLDAGGRGQAQIDALQLRRRALAEEIRAYVSGPGANLSQLDPAHVARLRDFDRRERELLEGMEKIRDAERARIRSELGALLGVPAGERAAWTHSDGTGFKGRSKNVATRVEARDWLESKLVAGPGATPIEVRWESKPKARAYASQSRKLIMTKADESPAIMIHEMGHHVEFRIPGAERAAKEFLAHRVGNQPLEQLRKVVPGARYRADELGRDDDFARAFGPEKAWYVGKHYSSGSTEILSMGLEMLYNSPVHFAKNDPEYCKFILGILDGSMRSPSP